MVNHALLTNELMQSGHVKVSQIQIYILESKTSKLDVHSVQYFHRLKKDTKINAAQLATNRDEWKRITERSSSRE